METFTELKERRQAWGIPLRQIHERLDCSYTWIRDLENGYHHGIPSAIKWKREYIKTLERLIKEKRKQIELCQ